MLKKWTVKADGTYLDDEKVSDHGLDLYDLIEKEYIAIRIGIDSEAVHQGGMNLFGEGFGDYGQNLVLTMIFDEEK